MGLLAAKVGGLVKLEGKDMQHVMIDEMAVGVADVMLGATRLWWSCLTR